jgi:hypothetical protein
MGCGILRSEVNGVERGGGDILFDCDRGVGEGGFDVA